MTDAVRRPPTAWGRSLTALGSAALAVVCITGGAALWNWFWRRPAPATCSLPLLPVPRPGDVMAWSPGCTQLLVANRRGGAWVVHFPDRSVRMLPRFGQTPWAAAWDAAGHPLLTIRGRFSTNKVVQFDAATGGWRTLPVLGADLAISPNGRWIAGIRGSIPMEHSTERRGGNSLAVWDVLTGTLLDQRALPGKSDFAVEWTEAGDLVASECQVPPRKQLVYRIVDGSLHAASPASSRSIRLRAEYVAVVIPGERTREQARQMLHLHNGPPPAADWHLWLRAHSVIQQDIPLGRRDAGRIGGGEYHTWKSASISPDGRYLVARAADDTLRLLERRH